MPSEYRKAVMENMMGKEHTAANRSTAMEAAKSVLSGDTAPARIQKRLGRNAKRVAKTSTATTSPSPVPPASNMMEMNPTNRMERKMERQHKRMGTGME